MKRIAIIENNILATNTIRQKLTLSLIQHGFVVRVFTTGTTEELQFARNRGVDVEDVKASNQGPIEIMNYIKSIKRGLKAFKPDVCLTFTIRPAIWGNLVTRSLRIPTISNITGTGPLFESNSMTYRIARMLYRFALKQTALVFFQNEDDRDAFLLRGYVESSRTALVPGSGVDTEKFSPMPAEPSCKFKFLFISRLIRDKGIMEYVEAARILKAKHAGITFQVLGPYWEQNLKSNIISPDVMQQWQSEGLIEYLGSSVDVRPFIANADCIVLPSYREGTSNVLLEAAAMERPAITCDVTGCRSVVREGFTGFLCRVRDAVDLSEKMEMMFMLSQDQRNEMGRQARQFVMRNFNKSIVIDAYLKAIREVTCSS